MKTKVLLCPKCGTVLLVEQRKDSDSIPYYCIDCRDWITHDKAEWSQSFES